MKKAVPTALLLLGVFLTTAALAEMSDSRSPEDQYRFQGERIARHLDTAGNRIERRFVHRAEYAAEQGRYHRALHFQAMGARINHRLDRKGAWVQSGFERRECRQSHHRGPAYWRGASSAPGGRHHDHYASLRTQRHGIWPGRDRHAWSHGE